MSKSVDTRVVQMQFDNTQFERNIGTSISSLNKLQDSLDMKGAAKSFKTLDKESQKVSLSGISNAVESVTRKFSVMETVAFSAVKNITDRAVDAGISIAKSLSIDQITAGWGKLNEETASVQTIMNATGKSLEEVEGYLQKLMWFSDETSYGFTDMTAALGQLTASGADIDAMIPMITGIANATAYAGKGAGEFQRSIYNLTQSFGAGHLQLMDWKSLEYAGTATAQLKQTLIDTAVELGKLEKVGDKVYVAVSGSGKSADELNAKLAALDEKYAGKKKTLTEKLNSELEKLQKKYYRKVTDEQYEDLERQLRAKYSFAAIEEDLEKEKAKIREKYSGSANTSGATEVDVGTFGTTLSEGWADTEVMTKAFAKFSELSDAAYKAVNAGEYESAEDAIEALSDKYDDLSVKAFKAAQTSKSFSDAIDATKDAVSSGWMTTFKTIAGNLEEQQVLWTELTSRLWDVFASGAEDRNEVLKEWKELGGRDDLIESLWNAWDAVGSVIGPIKDAFRDIFPKSTGEQLVKITRNLKELTAKMTLGEAQAEKVKETFKGVFAILDIGLSVIKAVAGGGLSLAKNLSGIPNLMLNVSSALGKWSAGLRNSVKETNVFGKAVDAVIGVIQKANDKIGEFASAVKAKFDAAGFTDFLGVLKAIYNFALKVGKVVVGLGASIGTALRTAFENGGIRGVIDVINTGLFGAILIGAKKFIDSLSDAFGGVTDILEGVSGVLEGVKGSLEAWQEGLNAETLSKIAKAIAILAISLAVVASIDRERLTGALTGVTALFLELMGAMSVFNKLNLNFTGVSKSITVMIGLSTSILILASALKKLASLEWDGLAVGLTGVFGLTVIIVAAATALSKIEGRVMKGATSIVIFSSAIKILASACKDLSALSWNELVKGLVGVGVLLAELDIFLNTAKFSGKAFGTATGIVALAGAIKILASAAKDFAAMKWSEIGKGLAAIGGLLAEIVAFTKLTANAKNVKSTGFALIEIAAAMKIFASAMESFSSMSWEELGRSLTGVAGALTAVTVAVKIMPKNVAGIGSGLVIVGAALNIIAAALTKLGKNSWGETAKGLTALGGSVAILAAGLKAMKGTLSAAAALTVAATALALLTPELKILGGMSIKQVGIGLVALAGAFTVLGTAAKLLSPLVGTMIKVSAAIALFGTGCALAGAGILAVSIALTTFAASLVLTASSLGETIVAICNSIADSADAIQKAFIALIKAGCNSITETVPVVAKVLLTVLVESLSSLKTYLPQIVDLLMDVAVDLLDRLSLKVPELVQSFVKMLGTFMESLDDALGKGGWKKLLLSVTAISAIFLALAAAAKLISSIPISGAVKGIAGFGIIVAGLAGVLTVLGGLAQIPGLSWLIGEGVRIFAQLGMAIGAFVGSLINGLVSNMPRSLSEVLTACASIEAIALAISPMSELLGNIDISGSAKGIAGVAILISGIAAILAALGGLSKIPGFNEIIGDGANVLLSIGNAIGSFVGGIVESLTGAVTSSLERVVSAVASVGTVISAVAVVAKVVGKLKVNPAAVAVGFAGIAVAIGCIEVILAALGGLAQIPGFEWLIGEGGRMLIQLGSILGEFVGSIISGIGVGLTSGLPAMGQNLSDFMIAARPFIDGAKEIDESVMKGILSLSAAILCITAADLISGITSFITGGSSIAKFGAEIAEFGPYLKQFSDSVSGINNQSVVAAANAAKALAEMANSIPNEGGLASWFAGENNVAKFGTDIASFGVDLKAFADNVAGIVPENVTAAAQAGKALAEMASTIPNEGGIAAWFAGENSVSKFGNDIVSFGTSIKLFSNNVAGLDVTAVTAAAQAGKALAEMASTIPNEGGVAAWFAGENSVSKFGNDIVSFGTSIKLFSDNVSGISPENVTAAAQAGKALAEMASTIPNEGGVAAWFAGENSLAKFGNDIVSFGTSIKSFSDNVSGISPENVTAAAQAGKALAEMASTIPNEGGVAAWFAGENSVSKFGNDIASFGTDLKAFSDNVVGISPENILAASQAGKALAEMASTIPNEGGVAAWFAGENSLAKFGDEIASFGTGIKSFSDNVTGLDVSAVTAASQAGKALAEMASTIPNEGGVAAWFAGENSLAKFGDEIASFGTGIKSLSNNVKGLDIPAVSSAVNAGKTLVDLTNSVPNEGGVAAWFAGEKSLVKFGDQIAGFGTSMKKFSDNVGGLNAANVTAAASAGKMLAEMMSVVPQTVDPTSFANALPSIAASVVSFTGSVLGSDTTGAVSQVRSVLSLLTTTQDTINTIDVYAINTAATACSTLASTINSMTGTVSITGYTAAIMEMADKFSSFVSVITALDIQNADKQVRVVIALIKDVSALNANGVAALGEALNTAGANGVAEFVKAFEDGAGETETAIDCFLESCVKVIDRAKPDFRNAGRNASEGFAKGIEDGDERVKKAAKKMAEEALNAVNSTLDINSPSKAFYKSGGFSGEGFVNALEDYGKKAYNAGEEMADNAKQGLSGAISKIMDMLNGELDDAPSIRPVLDLTDVEKGAKGIDALLSRCQAVTLGENIEKKRAAAIKTETPKAVQGDTIYNFNQTLNSPQELDALTINRQTKNMFARFATR